tara:strand:+ start:212 stop:604 length:393 start_codon:yes stop_codon:yes gene_type:complete
MSEQHISLFPSPIGVIYKSIPFSEREDGIGNLIKCHEKFKKLNIWYEGRFEVLKKILNELKLNWSRVKYEDQDCYIMIKYKSKDFLLSWLRDIFKDNNTLAFLILHNNSYGFKNSVDLKRDLEKILNDNL